MKRYEASSISRLCRADWAFAAAFVASCPARCACRPAGSGVRAMAPCMSSIRVSPWPWLNGDAAETRRSWAASPSGEVPRYSTESVVGTWRRLARSERRAVSSAASSGRPSVKATTGTELCVTGPISGCASRAAWLLGALSGRKAPLLSLT